MCARRRRTRVEILAANLGVLSAGAGLRGRDHLRLAGRARRRRCRGNRTTTVAQSGSNPAEPRHTEQLRCLAKELLAQKEMTGETMREKCTAAATPEMVNRDGTNGLSVDWLSPSNLSSGRAAQCTTSKEVVLTQSCVRDIQDVDRPILKEFLMGTIWFAVRITSNIKYVDPEIDEFL